MDKSIFVVTRDDWSLHRKGQLDQQRHQEKVREAIKNNLADIVSSEAIILSDGKQTVKVPIRSLEEYRFRFNFDKQKHVSQGSGGTEVGQVVGKAGQTPQAGAGKGEGAGEEPGFDYYEAEVTVDELAELIFDDLSLPRLKQKESPELTADGIRFNDIRKQGIMSNVDKKRTLLEAMKRNALAGHASYAIKPDDLRFKTWEEIRLPQSNAVVIAMMDTSGSMGTFEKYIARSFFFWSVRFLRTKYQNVNIVFLAHHTEAREVTEEEFFTKGESGGTRCSSVYELALRIVEERYKPNRYNIYPFHFSDGDNLISDNPRSVELATKLAEIANVFGYGEINPYGRTSTLMSALRTIELPSMILCTIRDKTEVYPALRRFFREEPEAV